MAKLCKDFQHPINFRTCGLCFRNISEIPPPFLDSYRNTLIQTLTIVMLFGFLTAILVSSLSSSQTSTAVHTTVSFFFLKHKYNHFIHSSQITGSLTKLSNLVICVKSLKICSAITLLETFH